MTFIRVIRNELYCRSKTYEVVIETAAQQRMSFGDIIYTILISNRLEFWLI